MNAQKEIRVSIIPVLSVLCFRPAPLILLCHDEGASS